MSIELALIDLINGIFTLLFVVISIIVGLRIIQKYLDLNRIELLTMGLTWIFLTSAWWGSTANFIVILITGGSIGIPDTLFLFLSNIFLPIALVCWMFSLSHIFYLDKEKQITGVFVILSSAYVITLIILLLLNPFLVGSVEGVFNSKPNFLVLIFQIFALFVCVIGGIIFSKKTIEQKNPEVKWKGIFLLVGFLTFATGGLFDALFPTSVSSLILIRLILIISAVFYYSGFFPPKKLLQYLIRANQEG